VDSLADFMTGEILKSYKNDRSYDDLTIITADDIMRFVPTVKPIISKILGKGEATIIAGKGGDGKSFLTLFIALAGASLKNGDYVFGEFQLEKPFSTLMIQAENSLHDLQYRLQLLVKKNPEFEQYQKNIKFLGFDGGCRVSGVLSDKDFQNAIIAKINLAKVGVIMWDPLISFSNENENDNTGMRKELDGLRYIMECTGVAAILVHHSSKSFEGGSSCLRGASAIRDWADNVIALRKIINDGDEYIKLVSEKSRNSRSFNPVSVKFTGLSFERTVVTGENKGETVVTALKQLGGEASTQTELGNQIVELIGGSSSTANRHIKEALDAGLIQEVKDGRSKGYKLVDGVDVDD
jgi:DNA-binding transcriptional ArsR family regulator